MRNPMGHKDVVSYAETFNFAFHGRLIPGVAGGRSVNYELLDKEGRGDSYEVEGGLDTLNG